MTISDRILETNLYKSGDSFGPMRMAKALGINRQRANHALSHMVNIGRAHRAGRGLYMKPKPKHWMHTAPPNNADKLKDARSLHAGRVLV